MNHLPRNNFKECCHNQSLYDRIHDVRFTSEFSSNFDHIFRKLDDKTPDITRLKEKLYTVFNISKYERILYNNTGRNPLRAFFFLTCTSSQ